MFILGFSKARLFLFIFVMGQSKMPITNENNLNFGVPQLITLPSW